MKRMQETSFLFGSKAFLEALDNQLQIKKVNLSDKHQKLLGLIKKRGLRYEIHSSQWFHQQFRHINHQEFVCVINPNQMLKTIEQLIQITDSKSTSTLVMLHEIQDPHNFGAILRTCMAAEVDGIIFKKHNQAPINSTVIRTSMGTVFYQNLVQVTNLSYAITTLQKHGFWTVATTLDERLKPKDYRQVDFDKRILLVGNEDKGLNALLLKNADLKVKIPMNPKLNSLNVSVAVGIILFGWKS
ncbi:23S rRNA (guanosine(2251)-2'-O)-methyltransferase RlmB [Mycoplasmoides pneumoniae]|uniref:23S rRNA (guanosine(2251)-2'-O)-methyltransferase RlmB n=1 Tax=Mycoplasmoides pneumoniae TaxID=2104 RepID=UPI00071BDCE6|nr:23S rRNA (guanosine(2251)-2'-O)-methyltransferase RlmB [Mycoplasmoides pneumoniae]